ncbi:hypothetical protein EJB05_16220, partial [Eragrostis curvula]
MPAWSLALFLLNFDSALLDVYKERNPLCTRASGFLDAAAPITGAADAGVKSKSLVHSKGLMVPRHATTMSRRPSAATPSSVATATYPIQLDSLHQTSSSAGGGRRRNAGGKVAVAVHARAGVRRALLRVEAVVGGLCELAVVDDGLAEVDVQRVKKAIPRVLALQLAPPLGDASGSRRRHGLL